MEDWLFQQSSQVSSSRTFEATITLPFHLCCHACLVPASHAAHTFHTLHAPTCLLPGGCEVLWLMASRPLLELLLLEV